MSTLGVITIAVLVYFLLRKQLLKDNTIEFVKSIKYTLIVPILQVICFLPLYKSGSDSLKTVGKIDSLRDLSTYSPLFGDELGAIARSGLLPEIERTQQVQGLFNTAQLLDQFVSIGLFIVIGLVLAELYGVFRLGKFTKKKNADVLLYYICYIDN